ncbi:MAG TPA: protein translocase subunit SecF [Pseudonocardiaceae bacterium]|nr:protein translocase subunit SecF [Pseudonocardiaceae bacterium]
MANDTIPHTVDRTPRKAGLFTRLYTGTGAFDIVGHRKWWYVVSALLVTICAVSIIWKGFHLGIDFEGGTKLQMPAASTSGPISTDQASEVFTDTLGKGPASVQLAGTGDSQTVQIRSETLTQDEIVEVKQALFDELQPVGTGGQPSADAISDSSVGASWGGEISRQALIALVVFLVLVSLFIGFFFQRNMAIAAIIALFHDLIITAGVYSLVGFEVSPATVIGLLTILGFSLYDTIVVFDKVQENTRGLLGLTRRTYGEAANLALNQTLMRSINTSLIAVLPVLGLLAIGVGLLGVGTLKDLALVQVVGIIAGAYSSITLATPLLVDLTMRKPAYQQQAQRVYARRESLARKAALGTGAAAPVDGAIAPTATDDDALSAELRREKALAAAASVPTRVGKGPREQRPHRARPSGKTGRPTGKKRR